jgi:protein-disulfide isomerase
MAKTTQSTPRNEKAAAARKQAQAQVRAEQRRTTALWILAGVVLVGVFAAIIVYITSQSAVNTDFSEDQIAPGIATEAGGIPVGSGGVAGEDLDESRVQLAVYLDFMCPVCGNFEAMNGAELDAIAAEGLADITYHPVSILDRTSMGTRYSTRAASAAALVADRSPEHFVAFSKLLFLNRPEEGTRGLTDVELVALAVQAGVPQEIADRIPEHQYAQWVTDATERASVDGMTGTPTLALNGVIQDPRNDPNAINWGEPGAIRAAVIAAAGE